MVLRLKFLLYYGMLYERSILVGSKPLLQPIATNIFFKTITTRVITLTFKNGNKDELGNWWPILLLNISYKIYTKVLQFHLQPMLMEVINNNQLHSSH